ERLGSARHVVICVPTPLDDHLLPDLALLRGACDTVVQEASPGQVIVLTSTSYVGTTRDLLVGPLEERGFVVGTDVYVGFSPERIDPGNTAHTHESVPRVFGGVTEECRKRLEVFLGCCTDRVHAVGSVEAAEMTKLFENTFRAVNIALANELADISRSLGLDAMEVISAASTKPYGFMPFFPGPGAGGHCIPCDPHYLLWQLRRHRVEAPLISEAMGCIARRPQQVVTRLAETLSGRGRGLGGSRVVVVGVTYKPDVEDVRESPALEILDGLQAAGAEIGYVDDLVPVVRLGDGSLLRSLDRGQVGPDDLVLLHTRHRSDPLDWLAEHPLVLDATYRATDLQHRVVL
ncbi:MAG: nucleotide sugar dehydrogenase, partial [Mycobacteriales bacterium]